MSSYTSLGKHLVLILLISALPPGAFGSTEPMAPHAPEPLAPLGVEEISLLVRGTTAQMMADWSSTSVHPENLPDRSFRNIWVRMFPLLSVPLGDPYPNTANLDELSLYNSGGLKLYGLDDGALLHTGKLIQFDFNANEVTVDGVAFVHEAMWIVAVNTTTTTAKWDANKVRVELRGGFVVKKSLHEPKDLPARELWSLINVITVNQYLQSVVPSEVIASWHRETLRAQAIAARTYGAYETAQSRAKGRDFDVDPSTWYQSYQGANVELPATTSAVSATGSKVITYQGEVIKALFSSNSGGRTCTLRECLELNYDVPYLREVADAPGIRNSPGGTWGSKSTLTSANIKAKLKEYGLEFNGNVKRLEHLEKGVSGRTWRLRMVLSDGSNLDLERLHTRKIMHLFGPIRSFWYTLGSVTGGEQAITGYGYGHAVGMSQWGAQLYAKAGWDANRILNHFYYNIKIADLAP